MLCARQVFEPDFAVYETLTSNYFYTFVVVILTSVGPGRVYGSVEVTKIRISAMRTHIF